MIISMNATVCVMGTIVSNQRFMIICGKRGRRMPGGEKRGSEQAIRKVQS
jgi:hypothetical protein